MIIQAGSVIVREHPFVPLQKSVRRLPVQSLSLLEAVCLTAERSLLPAIIVLTPHLHIIIHDPHNGLHPQAGITVTLVVTTAPVIGVAIGRCPQTNEERATRIAHTPKR